MAKSHCIYCITYTKKVHKIDVIVGKIKKKYKIKNHPVRNIWVKYVILYSVVEKIICQKE